MDVLIQGTLCKLSLSGSKQISICFKDLNIPNGIRHNPFLLSCDYVLGLFHPSCRLLSNFSSLLKVVILKKCQVCH